MILAFEDDKSRLLDVVSVAEDAVEERVEKSLVEILNLKRGRGLEPKFWSRSRCIRF